MKSAFSILTALVFAAVSLPAPVRADDHGRSKDQPKLQAFANPGTITLDPTPYSRVILVSDAHGMLEELRNLLISAEVMDGKYAWNTGITRIGIPAAKTLLVVLGDSIDKGKESVEVLNLYIYLQSQAAAVGGRVLHLLGNHEAEFLFNPEDPTSELTTEIRDSHHKGLKIADFRDPSRPYAAYLRSMPIAARIGNWYFSHSGTYPDMAWGDFTAQTSQALTAGNYDAEIVTGEDSVLERKDWWDSKKALAQVAGSLWRNGIVGTVFGHQTSAFQLDGHVGYASYGQFQLVKVDSGMAPEPEGRGKSGEAIEIYDPTSLMKPGPLRAYAIVTGVKNFRDGARLPLLFKTLDPPKNIYK